MIRCLLNTVDHVIHAQYNTFDRIMIMSKVIEKKERKKRRHKDFCEHVWIWEFKYNRVRINLILSALTVALIHPDSAIAL